MLASALGSVSLAWLCLAQPYPLVRLYDIPLLDLGKLAGYQAVAALTFATAYALLFALYLAAYRAAKQLERARDLLLVLGGALALCAVLLWVYPIGALDVYDNIFRAREWAVYDYNPLIVTPSQVSADAWYPYVVWTWAPSAYGPLWAYLSYALYALAGDDLLRNLLAHKLLAVVSVLAGACLIYALLRRRDRRHAVAGALLYAWNPLLLFESVVNAHNDAPMMALLLAALWLYAGRRFVEALLACVLAALIKVAALVVLPILLVAGWRSVESRLRFTLLAVALCALAAAVLYAPLWRGPDTLGGLALQNERFTTSAAAIVKLALEARWGAASAEAWTRGLFACLFAVAYLLLLRRTPSEPAALPRHVFGALAVLLVVGTLWFQPWYVLWPLALAPLAGTRQRRVAIVWSAGALALYIVFDFVWVWYADVLNRVNELVINLAATAVWLAPIALVYGWYAWRERLR